MEKRPRKTEFWAFQTPPKLGPGSYQLDLKKLPQNLPAPFALGEKRNLTLVCNQTFPGPGSYNDHSLTQPQKGGIVSKSPRFSPFSGNQLSPGPGHYSPVFTKLSKPQSEKRRALSLTVDPTPISIPSRMAEQRQLGPGTYTPSLTIVKPTSVKTAFGNYSVFRFVQQQPKSLTNSPGPGSYNVSSTAQKIKKNWYFSSQQSRITQMKNAFPGPGHYGSFTQEGISGKSKLDRLISGNQRGFPLANEIQKQYVSFRKSSRPVGQYFNKEQLNRIDQLREKFVASKGYQKKPGFGSSDGRFNKFSAFFVPGNETSNLVSPSSSHTRFL